MQRLQIWFAVYLLAMLTACAQLGVPPVETFNEKLAAAYSLNTQVRQTTADLLIAKKLSSADGQHVLEQTDSIRKGLDVVKELVKLRDVAAAEDKLASVRTILAAVHIYVTARKGS